MTDPQDDVPCRGCGTLTQHATEICDDCRTPAGRLVTALMDLNIDAEIDDRFVNVGCLIVDTNDEGMWSIDGHEEDGITAANAIAAIVQAPGLRADVDARIADAVAAERHAIGAWLRTSVRSAPFAHNVEHGDHIDDDAPPLPSLRMVMLARDEAWRQVEALTAERATLLARVGADVLVEVER